MDRCLKLCKTTALAISFYESKNYSCSELLSRQYYHPFNLKVGNITCGNLGNHICERENMYCNSWLSLIFLVLSIGFFCSSWAILCYIRYRALKHDCKKSGLTMNTRLCCASIKVTRSDSSSFKVPVLSYLLLIGFGIPLAKSCLITNNVGGFSVSQGGVICTSIGNVTLPKISHPINLMYVYKTSMWNFSLSLDWGCVSGSCPPIDDCNRMDAYEVGEPKEANPGHKWYKQTCKSYHDACFLGRGCWFGYYIIHTWEYVEVYSVSSIGNNHHIDLSLGPCHFSLFTAEERIIHDYSIVRVISTGSLWLCPQLSRSNHPDLNTLGDVQIFNGQLDFPWEQINCNHNWYNNKCNIPNSFISRLTHVCESIPGITSLGELVEEDGKILLRSNSPYDVSVSCPKNILILNNTNCYNIKTELWGYRKHSTGLYLASSAISHQLGQTTKIINPCTKEEILLPCTGEIIYTRVSEIDYESCVNVTDKTMDGSQYFITKYHTESELTSTNIIASISSSYMGIIGSLTGGGLLWILILILVLKR